MRLTGFGDRGFVGYRDLGGLDGDALDEVIARQIRFFSERGRGLRVEAARPRSPGRPRGEAPRSGFRAGRDRDRGDRASRRSLSRPVLPDGVAIREVTERTGMERIAALEEAVWDDDHGWLDALWDEREADPEGLRIFVAEAGGSTVVCAGWVRFPSGTEFATLWGGATLPEWRGRGIYRALVAERARLAAERGCRYLEVDASDDSRPILERLGFRPVTTTTPYIWSPPPRRA